MTSIAQDFHRGLIEASHRLKLPFVAWTQPRHRPEPPSAAWTQGELPIEDYRIAIDLGFTTDDLGHTHREALTFSFREGHIYTLPVVRRMLDVRAFGLFPHCYTAPRDTIPLLGVSDHVLCTPHVDVQIRRAADATFDRILQRYYTAAKCQVAITTYGDYRGYESDFAKCPRCKFHFPGWWCSRSRASGPVNPTLETQELLNDSRIMRTICPHCYTNYHQASFFGYGVPLTHKSTLTITAHWEGEIVEANTTGHWKYTLAYEQGDS